MSKFEGMETATGEGCLGYSVLILLGTVALALLLHACDTLLQPSPFSDGW